MNPKLRGDLLLLLAALIWGVGFSAQRAAMEGMGPMTFTGLRFLIGWMVLLPVLRLPQLKSKKPSAPPKIIFGLSLLLLGGALCQQIGLQYTSASKAGFLTGLYVVLVPVIGLAFGKRTHAATWLGALVTAAGLYYLSISNDFQFATGDPWVLLGAVIWSLHVIGLGHFAARYNPLTLAAHQFFVVGVLACALAFFTETIPSQAAFEVLPWLLYSGIFAVGGAFTLQAFGQAEAPPAHAAILLSLEAVFATAAGWLLLGEHLSLREWQGCGLMMIGILVSQFRPKNRRAKSN